MRPSSNMSFEPGLERGVPWGRDLFTFVTSAAGHMMRTLQKPRKNKPSKRQVNHRRFLHNMIQRKFAEIEAANQQLATALFSADTSQSQLKPKSHSHTIESLKNTEKATANSCETKTLSKQQDEVNDYRTLKSVVVNPNTTFFKSKALNHTNSGEDSHPWESVEVFEHSQENSPRQSAEQSQSTAADLDNLTQVTNMILEDSVFTWLENFERIRQSSEADITKSSDVAQDQQYLGITLFDMSLISPAVSPLSLDSCDFEEQMHPDSDHSSEVPQIQSLEMDVIENLELLVSSEEYLQSHHNDQTNMASSVWDIQSEEQQSCLQDSPTFLNISPEGYVIDNPTDTDCNSEVIPEGLETETLFSTLLESSAKDIGAENDLISFAACSLAPCGYAAREKDQTKDCYLSQLDISTSLNEKNGTWGASKTVSKGLEQRDFTNHILHSQALQKPEHAPPNQTPSIYWHQHPTHENHTQIRTTDPYYVMSGTEKNRSIQTGVPLTPNLAYVSPPTPLSPSLSHCFSFEGNREDSSTYRGDFCSSSVSEADVSIASFEGVAQSFPAPVNKPHPYSISTPPLNDDWLFSNIVAEQEFNSVVRSQGCAHC